MVFVWLGSVIAALAVGLTAKAAKSAKVRQGDWSRALSSNLRRVVLTSATNKNLLAALGALVSRIVRYSADPSDVAPISSHPSVDVRVRTRLGTWSAVQEGAPAPAGGKRG
jgi:hypothetical protein